MEIAGTTDERFAAVREQFAANFAEGSSPQDVGASVAVTVDGELVVDLWAGTVTTDTATDVAWERDTIINVWSTTKTVTALAALMLADQGELDVDAPAAHVLARVRRQRQGRRAGAPSAQPHRRSARLGRADDDGGPPRLGGLDRQAGSAGAVVGAGHRQRLPRHHPGVPRRRGDPPGRGSDRWRLRARVRHRSARCRLPHRDPARARRRRRPRHPAAGPVARGHGRDRTAHLRQSAARRRRLDHGRVAAGRDPGCRRPRQRPLGGDGAHPDGQRRRGDGRAAAVPRTASTACSGSSATPRT